VKLRDDEATQKAKGPTAPEPLSWILTASAEGLFVSIPLSSPHTLLIGRASGCELRLDAPGVSRKHAQLTIGQQFIIRDLNSTNGVFVRGKAIPPDTDSVIEPGDLIEIGSVVLVVRKPLHTSPPCRIWTHGYFEGRIDEECARARHQHTSFSVLHLTCTTFETSETIEKILAQYIQSPHVLARYAPHRYEILFLDMGPEQALAHSQPLIDNLAQQHIRVRSGWASFPEHGHTAEHLVAHASAGVQTGTSSSTWMALPDATNSAMEQLHDLVARVAPSNISVLILGETGVGKEVCAERIHTLSTRKNQPFLRLNCTALTESLLESELFGHERGAFSGAFQTKRGLLESAHRGTVFLDELGDLPLSIQVKLLRVLEERKFRRVGSVDLREVDVRFIAATNRNLETDVVHGNFRQDLYFRINGVTLNIPPLRERMSELQPLVRQFIEEACQRDGLAFRPSISPSTLPYLMRYHWPGNIRELRNVVHRAVLLCGSQPITPEHLPLEKMQATLPFSMSRMPQVFTKQQTSSHQQEDLQSTISPPPISTPFFEDSPTHKTSIQEKKRILEALELCAGNQTRAARMLGISRGTLVSRLDVYGIARPRKAQRNKS
jgi:two-component system, NtrC family, response regulator AtoC